MNINSLLADKSNYSIGRTKNIEYLVIHYTANNGDTAKGNCKYFQGANRNASAHYFVDETEIWQSVEEKDTAWHCGTTRTYYHKFCRNENSIGIELCSEKDSNGEYYFNNETIQNAVLLVKSLMQKYNISLENVIRHYDVTHKNCPAPMVNNVKFWDNFKTLLKDEKSQQQGQEKSQQVPQILKRSYTYDGKTKEIEVVNIDGSNYVKVRDLAELLGNQVSYDDVTKVTNLS